MDSEFTFGSRPALTTYEGVAKMIDHSLLRPELSHEQIVEGCRIAREYHAATVCARPSDLDEVVRLLDGSDVLPTSVAGFPHGDSTTGTKLYECRDLLRRGAKEVDMVINIGRLISRDFQYVETEVMQMAKACHESGALLKVIFENAYLTDDLKIIACKICKRSEADFVKTSTGFAPSGYTKDDLLLMKRTVKDRCRVKAAGGVRSLETALEVYQCGCDRFGATQTAKILDDWKTVLAGAAPAAASSGPSAAY